jgi:aspartate kinase
MIIMKFGGTSLEDAASVERVCEIIRARLPLKPVVVVSAMGKATRGLLEAAEASAAGDARTTLEIVADLRSRHLAEAEGLVRSRDGRQVFQLIEAHFEELKKLLEGLAILREVPPRALDKILSYGELLSSAIVADALTERGIPARLLDSRELIKTDERFGGASPLIDLTNAAIAERLIPALDDGTVPVIQGFIGSTRGGASTTLGFEGSDYTATIVGAGLPADDIQIWKDVSGLMTADPRIYPGARTVKRCTYAEAAELTFFGAKVLHPKAIHPARQNNIPVHIYNSKQPHSTGTEITAGTVRCANLIKSIAYKRPVSLVRVRDRGGEDSPEPSSSAQIPGLYDVAALLSASSGSSRVLAVDAQAWEKAKTGLAGRSTVETVSDKGIVTIVGDDMRRDHGSVARVFKAIRGIDVDLVVHGSSPIAMHMVVARDAVEEVVARLHHVFFEHLDPDVFE